MKKLLFFISCCGFSLSIFSENLYGTPASQSLASNASLYSSVSLTAGYFEGNFFALNHYIEKFGTNRGFNLFFPTVGINTNGPLAGRYPQIGNATFNFEIVIPQQITEGDTFNLKMSGWHLFTNFNSHNFLENNKHIALIISSGVDWGVLSLKKKNQNAYNIYKNGFIAPVARAEIRFSFSPLFFGFRSIYRYDITNKNWKDHGSFPSVFPGSRIYGFGFQFFIGFAKTLAN